MATKIFSSNKEKLDLYKDYIRKCTSSPSSADNYSDFRRINMLLQNRHPDFTELLDYDDTIYLQSLYDELCAIDSFEEFKGQANEGKNFKKIGNGQYHNAFVQYLNFLKVSNLLANRVLNVAPAQQTLFDEKEIKTTQEVAEEPFSIKKMIGYIEETGLLYTDSLVKRFAFSLMSKRFLILSGLAGSGKTQLALAFASALVKNKDEQMCVVSVGADWTNREPLLGFPNALLPGKYVKPESGVLDLLIEANRPENADKPFFLILD